MNNDILKKKYIEDKSENRKGLHIFRMIYFNNLFIKNMYVKNNIYLNNLVKNGYCVIENVLDEYTFNNLEKKVYNSLNSNNNDKYIINNKKIVNLFNLINNIKKDQYSFKLNIQKYNNEYDEQRNLHSDSLFPKIKCWLYINDIDNDNGSFKYVEKSTNISNNKMLKFYYNISNLDKNDPKFKNHTEYGINGKFGSPRVYINDSEKENEILEKMDLQKPTSMNYKKNTLVIANTFGFHKRGFCKMDNQRLMLEYILDI